MLLQLPPSGMSPTSPFLKRGRFWALLFIVFTLAFTQMTLLVQQNQYLIDSGFKSEFAAWALGFSGILRSGGTIVWGSVLDRTMRETSFTLSALLGVIALPCLLWAQVSAATWPVVLFVLLNGLGYGGVS